MTRTFTHSKAVREAVPLLIGLYGPSGSGKTYSALRLAAGISRVTGKPIYVIDTEAKRAKHYADIFDFQHIDFQAPFGPLDYLAAIEHCVQSGAGTIVIDSMSHEHEGPGGVLEMHEQQCEHLAKLWRTTRDKVQLTAWAKPKAERRRLLNSMVQTGVSVICCFRAKEKLKPKAGKEPEKLGWMPISADEFAYEMTCNMLLPPGSGGVPEWSPGHPGERAMTKLPRQFEWLRTERQPLSEDVGERMARWAAGDSPTMGIDALLLLIQEASTLDELEATGKKVQASGVTGNGIKKLREAYLARKESLEHKDSDDDHFVLGALE